MLAKFDTASAWSRVTGLFEESQCPPVLRYRAYRELAEENLACPSIIDVEIQDDWQKVCVSQRQDGSFGDHEETTRRILPTLWSLASLNDLGGGPGILAWDRAAEFLCQHARVDGAFSIDGRTTGVLSCYTSIFAKVLARARRDGVGKRELTPQLRAAFEGALAWLERFQQVRRRGVQLRRAPLEIFEERLATRYGGCFAATTCFTGLVRAAEAFVGANRQCELLQEIREDLLRRKLFMTSRGSVLPLTSHAEAAPDKISAWLRIQYPTGYHVDLVEVLDVVAASGRYDARMEPALCHLFAQQLPDGSWPLQAKAKLPGLHAPERVNQRRGSPWATFRVLSALRRVKLSTRVKS